MSWHDRYRSRLHTPEGAARLLQPGQRVYLGGNAATPDILTAAIAARAEELQGLTVAHVLLLGRDPFAEARQRGHIRHHAFFVGPADREAVQEGRADYVPCHLSEIPRILRSGAFPLDATVLMTAPPDAHGFLSLGVEVLASLAAAETARTLIVQVNPRMPRVHGNAFIHVDQVDAFVEAEEPLGELTPAAPDDVDRAIAANIVPLIPEGATLQLGIGGIPNAVVQSLGGRSDLGVHSEMISDGVMNAVEAGIVTGACKSLHPRKVVTTFVLGSRALYDWVDDNPRVEAHPCDYTNDLLVAAQNRRLVAINSAISVDLTGQVNSDSMGSNIYSGVGGQVDFIRAAARSEGGVPIIALPSTAKNGAVSRITPLLAAGAGVVTSRADVHYVVTEHGAAHLFGKPLRERAESLIRIADPRHRDALTEAARERRLL
jgi:4-hydroxybutyrate CoA-transferase